MDASNLDPSQKLAEIGFNSIGLRHFAELINAQLATDIAPSLFFKAGTIASICDYLLNNYGLQLGSIKREIEDHVSSESHDRTDIEKQAQAANASPSIDLVSDSADESTDTHSANTDVTNIAITGYSARVSGARDCEEFWRILESGQNTISAIDSNRFDWEQVTLEQGIDADSKFGWLGQVPGIDEFDPLFFNISPREAVNIDPRQRLLLLECWRALEQAGIGNKHLRERFAVYVGVEDGDYAEVSSHAGQIVDNHNAILAARLSYFLDLKGPVLAINTACSSGLVAFHQACLALRTGEVDAALVASANLILSGRYYTNIVKMGMLSPAKNCQAFGAHADGMVPGEAVAALVLKPLAKAVANGDDIKAVVRGSGINYDGATNGMTAPASDRQAELVASVYQQFAIDADDIEYIVSHGTGTVLGDPAEVNALAEVFRKQSDRTQFCALTSNKPNIGHSLAASGLVNLINLVKALEKQCIPASINASPLNDQVNWQASPFYVNLENRPWPSKDNSLRYGAVSSFGMSGTNAHVVLSDFHRSSDPINYSHDGVLLVLSAKSDSALRVMAEEYLNLFSSEEIDQEQLLRASYTLLCGRVFFRYRLAIVAHDIEEARQALDRFLVNQTVEFAGVSARSFRADDSLTEELARIFSQQHISRIQLQASGGIILSRV